jgi:hypothetical protein
MDFNENSIGSFPTRELMLRFHSATVLPLGNSHVPNQAPLKAPSIPLGAHLRGNSTQSLTTQPDSVTESNSSTTPHKSLVAAATAQCNTLQPPNLVFLELCVNTGKLLKSLGEIDVSSIKTDGDFFSMVKTHYLRLRSFRARFWLLKPVNVSYVRVRLSLTKSIPIPPSLVPD